VKYLLHGSVIADFLQGQPHVHARLTSTAPIDLAIASVSVMELRYSFILRPDLSVKTESVFNALLDSIVVIDFRLEDARESARILAEARAREQPLNALSAQLCGMARVRDMALIIANRNSQAHPFTSVNGLRLIDWGTPAV
jgi:predicted nucleic acid-binding protein